MSTGRTLTEEEMRVALIIIEGVVDVISETVARHKVDNTAPIVAALSIATKATIAKFFPEKDQGKALVAMGEMIKNNADKTYGAGSELLN